MSIFTRDLFTGLNKIETAVKRIQEFCGVTMPIARRRNLSHIGSNTATRV